MGVGAKLSHRFRSRWWVDGTRLPGRPAAILGSALLPRSDGRMEPAPGGGGQQLDIDLGQDLVVTEGVVELTGGDDGHTLGA